MSRPDIKKVPPQPLSEFRNDYESEFLPIPELAKNRRSTDVGFLILFVTSLAATIVIVACNCAFGADYKRFLNGYDKCGDTCGSTNEPVSTSNCSGKNLQNAPFMKYRFAGLKEAGVGIRENQMIPDVCVDECPEPSNLLFHRCIPKTNMNVSLNRRAIRVLTFVEFVDDFHNSTLIIIFPMCMTGLVLSVALFFALHYSPYWTVYSIIGVSLVALFCFAAYLWDRFIQLHTEKAILYGAIFTTIAIFFLAIFICYFHDRYELLIEMFVEATNATFKMPGLIFLPLVTLLVLAIVITSTVLLCALMSTNQDLNEVQNYPRVLEYVPRQFSQIGISVLVLMTIWLLSFANGCQCLIVAGPVSCFYFQRDKSHVRLPVLRSCYILLRYHLGTVACGSLCITMITVARVLLNFFEDHLTCRCGKNCLEYALTCFEQFVEYLCKRAYIQTAMHGKSLYKSGMRACRLLWANLMDTVALDVAGDFVMCCATILIVVISLAMGILLRWAFGLDLKHSWSIFLIGSGASGATVYFFTQIINVAVETVFICYCEDKLLNDGKTEPYYMSDNLKSLVERAKRATRRREQEEW